MELLQLEMFSHLAKYENMSVVAQIMNTSQPHISRMLASLEAELNVRLFDRVGRNILLNEQIWFYDTDQKEILKSDIQYLDKKRHFDKMNSIVNSKKH